MTHDQERDYHLDLGPRIRRGRCNHAGTAFRSNHQVVVESLRKAEKTRRPAHAQGTSRFWSPRSCRSTATDDAINEINTLPEQGERPAAPS